MQRTLKLLTLFVVVLFIGIIKVNADFDKDENTIVCDDYDKLGLQIIYYKNIDTFRYKFEYNGKTYDTNYNSTGTKYNFGIAKWGKAIDATIEFDEKIMKKIRETKICPTAIRVGVYSKWSVNFPSAKALISWLTPFITQDADDLINDGYSVMTLGSGYVFITDEETYNEKYKQYEEGQLEGFLISSLIDRAKQAYNAVGIPVLRELAAVAWSLLAGPADEIWNLITAGDGLRVVSYEEVVNFGIARYNGAYATVNANCPSLGMNFVLYQQTIGEYNSCATNTCKQEVRLELNKIQDNLKSYCSTILKTKSYTDAEKDCLLDCLNMPETLNEYKQGTDLYDDKVYKGDTCGLPVELIIWIENILRWVKYIIPIVLIALSILDFIKALASEKEDEMKKAQKHFITRLIAAALIFIMPIILEFVMGKMGFTAESCGIDNIGF